MKNSSNNSALDRIYSILDANSFVEIGANVTARSTNFHLYKEETPADGVLTGYGLINGQLVYIYSQDASILGGSIGEMNSRKITNIYDMALRMGAPVIGILDCSGLRLQESTDALYGLGSIYQKQTSASGIIPQITYIAGNCGGGVSLISALSDFTFIEKEHGNLFLQSPNTIPSNHKESCDTSCAEWKSKYTQCIDFCGTEEEIAMQIRQLIHLLPANHRFEMMQNDCTDDLNRLCYELENTVSDPVLLLSMIADQYEFIETKKETAKEMTTGFLRLNGFTIGCIANRQKISDTEESFSSNLTASGAKKAADLIRFCDAFHIPVLTISNVNGFESSFASEIQSPDAFAALTSAYTSATVPKVTLITEKAMGSAGVIMGGKSLGIDLVYSFENAMIGSMDGDHAAKIHYEKESAAFIRQKAIEYDETHNTAKAAASHGYIDMIIKAQDTRKYLISAFEMLATKQEFHQPKNHLSI